ncbi:MAG: hypothetical protein DRQ88_10415 [Epsilonproteobacteria bacterium]|nr:MAG: hypothetical protein DRQ88_10415 [Campylobacterota bacterium]RLA65825.1 MAG: hypothetical protein DRQ89_00295 [Campylobacterota bacterium]
MNYNFYLIIPPGMETIALQEFKEKWQIHFPDINLPQSNISLGGIEVETTLEQGLCLNYILKIPGRILLRLDRFKCRDFPKLFNKLKKTPWNNYLLGQIPTIKSSSKKSRIFDSRKIEKTANDAITTYYKGQPPKKKSMEKIDSAPEMTIYLRFDDDICTVAVDTSGERLHKRGQKTLVGVAPLRENLAAGMVYFFKQNAPDITDLIDPMCGSGTTLIEAFEFYKIIKGRAFAFEFFPSFKELPKIKDSKKVLFENFMGMDKDPNIIEAAKKNSKDISFLEQDLFTGESHISMSGVIFNPPYGKRIKLETKLEDMAQRAQEKFAPKMLGILVPESIHFALKAKKTLSFSNGGIKVKFYLL